MPNFSYFLFSLSPVTLVVKTVATRRTLFFPRYTSLFCSICHCTGAHWSFLIRNIFIAIGCPFTSLIQTVGIHHFSAIKRTDEGVGPDSNIQVLLPRVLLPIVRGSMVRKWPGFKRLKSLGSEFTGINFLKIENWL